MRRSGVVFQLFWDVSRIVTLPIISDTYSPEVELSI